MKDTKRRMIVLEVEDGTIKKVMDFLKSDCGVELVTSQQETGNKHDSSQITQDHVKSIPKAVASLKNYEENDIDGIISDLLTEIGIPVHILGYQYLRYAVRITIEDMKMINSITKQMYPTVAKRFNTTPSRTERAIRHAIEVAFDRGNVEVMDSLFGYSINSEKGKPTNSEFIATIADKLRLKLKKYA